ncbi:transcription elongation factor GreA [Zhenhengia yiwuensis]|uniref:Transcription elongation factor GreA n=1 Tax=Zhenhengia yiwuensis TaxID=2763666 RepID=A0A926IFW3_9FIRM|nr:transcription elongation factor GreA [Zhenhengia yiwuensis]MBC8581303.1 transcription elongation factor GreA [Zhenhengia yiwuensis]
MRNFLSKEDIEEMQKEIEYRKVVERKRLIEDVKEARAHGDLSENFEYKAAKRERGKNESRIRYLERMIKTAKIISTESNVDEVGLNKQVRIKFLDDDFEMIYMIVTTMNTDAVNDKISIESPLGKALFKKKVGQRVKVEAPEETYEVEILEIL